MSAAALSLSVIKHKGITMYGHVSAWAGNRGQLGNVELLLMQCAAAMLLRTVKVCKSMLVTGVQATQ